MTQQKEWWKEAVIYQIYPRSFKDSNGDGIGDLQGIISELDYVQNLGIDVIWLNPIYASPNNDNGYDISNYREIMKDFGTMEDFDRLLQEAHQRGLKIVMDLVVNHTSDQHPWFIEGRQSRENPYYNYYHWWPAEKGTPPVRPSYFDEDGTAWKYNKYTDSYYLHYFSREQPDLNWENPKVRKEIYEIMKFWLDKGIDGFRMDSITLIAKDPSFPSIDEHRYPDLFSYYSQGPRLHEYLQEMNREVLSRYNSMSVGEGSEIKVQEVYKFVEPERKELNMLYGFGPCHIRNKTKPDEEGTGIDYSLVKLKKMFGEWDKAVGNGWPTIYLGNHDQPRMISRFGSEAPGIRELSAKMLITFLLTMRGTPYWYAGDEIGMTNIHFKNIYDYRDIDTLANYRKTLKEKKDLQDFMDIQENIARDNARTPFQWNDTSYAGFTTGTPWIKINSNYKNINAEKETESPDSVLNYFKKTIKLRKLHSELIYGTYTLLEPDHTQVYSYLREGQEKKFLVTLNFSSQKTYSIPTLNLAKGEIILHNYADRPLLNENNKIELRPYEAIVWELT